MTTPPLRLAAGPTLGWRVAVFGAAILTPPLLRAVPWEALPRHLVFAAVVAGVAALATRGDPGMERRLRWREWTHDVTRAVAVFVTLAFLCVARLPGETISARGFAVILALLVPAIVEESVFRALLARLVTRRTAPWITSAAFALAHLDVPFGAGAAAGLLAHAVAGFAFFSLKASDGSLVAPTLAHAAYNAAVIAAMK